MAVARSLWGRIERRDHRLMHRMNRWRPPRWIRIWTITVTRLGDGWVWYGLGLLLLGYGGLSISSYLHHHGYEVKYFPMFASTMLVTSPNEIRAYCACGPASPDSARMIVVKAR